MQGKKMGNRILSAILALIMVIGMCPVVPVAATTTDDTAENTGAGHKLSFQKVEGVDADVYLPAAKDDQKQEEAPYADTDVVRVSIVLSKAATLERYSATGVASNNSAMAYREQLQKEQAAIVERIEKALGQSLDVVWNMTLAANIVSANVLYGQIEKIAAVRGVKEVFIENQYAPLNADAGKADPMMSTSTSMTGSTTAWAAGYTGAGSRIAIIDTGLDTDHQSFDNGAFLYSLEQLAAQKNVDADAYIDSLDLMNAEDVAAVIQDLNIYSYIQYLSGTNSGAYYINEKIPFAINYVDRSFDVTHDNDNQGGHGSHVAGIAVANSYIPQGDGYANAMATVSMQGVAPDAQVIVMKVFGKSGGAYDSDYMIAIEDAILLGCDVVNLSLGTDKGFARNRTYQDILDSLAGNDVIVAVAAGNSGAWAEYAANGSGRLYIEDVDFSMVATPSTATNALSVASADNAGSTNYYIQVGDQILFYDETIPTTEDAPELNPLYTVAGDKNYIFIDGIGTVEDVAAVVAKEGAIAPGTVFVCSRGTINFAEKANNAVAAGFAATIVYNNVEGALYMNMSGYNTPEVPAVSISLANGMKLKEAAEAVTDEEGNVLYYKGTMYISDKVTSVTVTDKYQMSDFSSWGVPGSLELKPEITAPGGNIYSVDGENPNGTAYMNNSGTSMASPQIAGMAALVMQYIEETGLDVKTGLSSRKLATSLLMSTAEPMRTENGYYSVLQQGAGLANVGNAVLSQSYVMMADGVNAGADDGKIKVELGDDPDRTGKYSFSFTLNNFGTVPQIYSLSGDFFTQMPVMMQGVIYADNSTTALDMGVDFQVEGNYIDASERYDCDLNNDGITDAKDAQVILEYAAGNLTEIADAADVSKNGTVSTYDAHLLLASIGSGYFMVKPDDSITVTVTMELTEATKAQLDEIFVNGAYVEGFVNVQPLVTEEGQVTPAHSIPVLGFYGNWSDAAMFERLKYEEYVYASANGTSFVYPYTGYMNLLTFFDEGDNEHTFVGNPYVVEDEFPTDKVAIRPEMEIGMVATTLIRNAGSAMLYVMDGEGNVTLAETADQLEAAYYYQNAGYWVWVQSVGADMWLTPYEMGKFEEGDKFTLGFMAVPEYYETDGALTTNDMLELMKSGKIGDGAYINWSFTVDGTAPEMKSVEILEDGNLKITAKDNRHIAAVAVLTASGGSLLTISGVEQDELGETVETVIDMEGVRVNRNCMIMVADYAGNESYYLVENYNEGLNDFAGRMYGFTNAKTLGVDNSWLEIDVENLYYYGGDLDLELEPAFGGTQDVAGLKYAVTAAEYVGGYVYMITEKNELRVCVQGDWENSLLAAVDSRYSEIKDLAFNTSDSKLYALGSNSTVYTLDLYTGELVEQYKVTVAAPEGKTFTTENMKLLTLTIDDEGNFYSVNNGDSNYKFVYLYKWSAADVTDGKIEDLAPVNNTKDGYAGEYVYNDDIPTTGAPTIQSMAWDHENDKLYWASALNAASPYNYLYTFDTETGKATVATPTPMEGVEDYCVGCLCVNVSGLYIVPKESVKLDTTNTTSDLILSRDKVTLLVGAEFKVAYDVLPWHLTDKSVTWVSSNPDVASVDATGLITAKAVGTAVITATTNASPNLSDSITVKVEEIEDVELNAMLYNDEGIIEWVSFNLLDSENWTSNFKTGENSKQFVAGGLHEDMIYVHDNDHMYGVNADTFEVTDYGYLDATWYWSDATTGPETPDGYFDRLVGIINNGQCIGVMDVPRGMGYEVSNYRAFAEDKAALIAYVGPTTYHDGVSLCNGHEYYILTEGGNLYHEILYAFYDADMGEVVYTDALTYVGSTGLNLSGMANTRSDKSGSMYYDNLNDYLIVTSYRSGTDANIYVFQPDACAPVHVGTFGTDVWPVISLYNYNALTDLTVKVKPDKASCYEGETVQLSAAVYQYKLDNSVTWSSSDETVATVDKNGLVTALAGGTVTITATSKEKNSAGEYATASATITIEALTSLDVIFHAYAQTEDGGKWIAVDGKDMTLYSIADSDAVYTGAAVNSGLIYATDDQYYYVIDPNGNAYTVTKGDDYTDGDGADFLYIQDGTYNPKQTVDFTDALTGELVPGVEVGGQTVYISGDAGDGTHYLTFLTDYTTGEYVAAPLEASHCPAAIAYHYSEMIESVWFDFYYVLGYDGILEHYEIGTEYAEGEAYMGTRAGWSVDYIDTGLEFTDADDLSMTYLETEDFKGVVISHATENGTELWCFDVEANTLGKIGVVEGAIDLVGLTTLDEVPGVTLPEPEKPVEAEYVYGYVKTASGYAWVKINTTTLAYEELATDTYGYTAAAALNGKIYAVTSATKHGNTTYTFQQVEPDNSYAMSSTSGDVAHTNGYIPADFAAAPSNEVTLVDSTNGNTYTKTMGGYVIDIANGKYSSSQPKVFMMKSYTSFDAQDDEVYFPSNTFSTKFAGIVYVGSSVSEDNKLYHDDFLILDQAGGLYRLRITSCLKNGTVTLCSDTSVETIGTIGLTATGASMSRITENRVYISVNNSNKVDLYLLDLNTYTLTSVGTLNDFASLVGLHTDAELTGVFGADPEMPEAPECDHSNVGEWESDETHHWKTCQCGEKVEQGEHSSLGEWESDETNHWKTCECGAKVDEGEHEFEEGKCECGAEDPNYKPEQPEDTKTLIAYVTTDKGNAWVAINTETLEITALSDYSDVVYDGAGLGTDGMIYTSVDGKYVQINVANDFAATTGGDTAYSFPVMDGTSSAPAQTVMLKDQKNGAEVEVTVGGYMHYVTKDDTNWPYLMKLYDYSVPTYKAKDYTGFDDVEMEAIAYISSELLADNTFFYEHYLVLNKNGDLFKLTEKSKVYGGTLGWNRTNEMVGDLNLDVSKGASMTMLSETVALICANGASGAALYTFDLTTNALTKLGDLNGVTDLVGLSLVSGITVPEAPECDHSNVGEWESDETHHWKTCQCGEKVEQGEHSSLGEWESDETNHWKTCECGAKVDEGEHEFEEGKCECGAEDPNYQPEQPEQPGETVSTLLHGYIKTASGYAWVKIDSATGAVTVLSEGNTEYFGGGVSDGKIYVSTENSPASYVNMVDPANGYAFTAGTYDYAYSKMVDLTSAPAKSVELAYFTCSVGIPVYLGVDETTGSNYAVYMGNYAKKSQKEFMSLSISGTKPAAIAYVSAEMAADRSYYTEQFVILCENGALYDFSIKYTDEGGIYGMLGTLGSSVNTGLSVTSGASMTLVAENELIISINTASGVDLYSYNLTNDTATKLSTVSGAQSLIGLSLLSDVQGEQAAKAANAVTGNLMSVYATTGTDEQEGEAVMIANGEVTIQLAETESVTNGLLTITYDPEVLTFKQLNSASVAYAVNSSEPGKLVIAYAAASAVSANDVLATLVFTYEGAVVNTTVNVQVGQRNENSEVEENATAIAVCNLKVESTSITLGGTISANYYMTIPEEVANNESAYMEVTKPNGETEKIYISNLEQIEFEGKMVYKIVSDMGVPAKEMPEDIVSKLYCDDEMLLEKSFCVKDYADYVLENSDDENLKALLTAMLHYGAYAQIHFDHNTGNLANQDLSDYTDSLAAVTADDLKAFAQTPLVQPQGVTLYSASLLLKSETIMRLSFKIDESIDPDTVTFNGEKASGQRNGMYYVDITNIAAQDLGKDVTVEICVDGTVIGEVSYSPMRYCYSVLSVGTDEDMVNLAKALYLYNQAAIKYFEGRD